MAPHEMTAWLERVRAVRKGKISLVEVERAQDVAMEVAVGAASPALAAGPALTPGQPDRVGDLGRWLIEADHAPFLRLNSTMAAIMPVTSRGRGGLFRKTPQVRFTTRSQICGISGKPPTRDSC